jgi:hypothetical protein
MSHVTTHSYNKVSETVKLGPPESIAHRYVVNEVGGVHEAETDALQQLVEALTAHLRVVFDPGEDSLEHIFLALHVQLIVTQHVAQLVSRQSQILCALHGDVIEVLHQVAAKVKVDSKLISMHDIG